MGLVARGIVSITLIDGVKRTSVITVYVPKATAEAYLDAADQAARDATAIGILMGYARAMSDMVFVKSQVGLEVLDDSYAIPAVTILRGNKLQFLGRAAGFPWELHVPGRKAASFTQNAGELSFSLTTPTAMSNFVGAVEGTAINAHGDPIDIQSGLVVD